MRRFVGGAIGGTVGGFKYVKAAAALGSEQAVDKINKIAGDAVELTRSQARNLKELDNVIDNNLKNHDFTGTWSDMVGKAIPNGSGGFYDHMTEMFNSHKALQKIINSLTGTLKNLNLTKGSRELLQGTLNRTHRYLEKIESLFETFGGMSWFMKTGKFKIFMIFVSMKRKLKIIWRNGIINYYRKHIKN